MCVYVHIHMRGLLEASDATHCGPWVRTAERLFSLQLISELKVHRQDGRSGRKDECKEKEDKNNLEPISRGWSL